MTQQIASDQSVRFRCPPCGGSITARPSPATYGLWQGTGRCGMRIEVTGRRTRAGQPREGLRVQYLGGCTHANPNGPDPAKFV